MSFLLYADTLRRLPLVAMLCKFCDKFCKKVESVLLLALPVELPRLVKLCCNCASASVAGDALAEVPVVVLAEAELN